MLALRLLPHEHSYESTAACVYQSLAETTVAITNMSDTVSLAPTVSTRATHFTTSTRSSVRSSRSTRTTASQRRKKAQEWRLLFRDTFANVFDLIGDWAYFYAVYNRDYDEDGEADQFGPIEVDAKLMIHAVFAFCILSTTLFGWFILTSIWRKGGHNSMCCNCTVNRIMLANILLEDFPQLALTTYIDYSYVGGLTPIGVMNICSSLTALVNRLTARYDEIEEEDSFPVVITHNYKEMP